MHIIVFSEGKDGISTGRLLSMTMAAITIIAIINGTDKLDNWHRKPHDLQRSGNAQKEVKMEKTCPVEYGQPLLVMMQ